MLLEIMKNGFRSNVESVFLYLVFSVLQTRLLYIKKESSLH